MGCARTFRRLWKRREINVLKIRVATPRRLSTGYSLARHYSKRRRAHYWWKSNNCKAWNYSRDMVDCSASAWLKLWHTHSVVSVADNLLGPGPGTLSGIVASNGGSTTALSADTDKCTNISANARTQTRARTRTHTLKNKLQFISHSNVFNDINIKNNQQQQCY